MISLSDPTAWPWFRCVRFDHNDAPCGIEPFLPPTRQPRCHHAKRLRMLSEQPLETGAMGMNTSLFRLFCFRFDFNKLGNFFNVYNLYRKGIIIFDDAFVDSLIGGLVRHDLALSR